MELSFFLPQTDAGLVYWIATRLFMIIFWLRFTLRVIQDGNASLWMVCLGLLVATPFYYLGEGAYLLLFLQGGGYGAEGIADALGDMVTGHHHSGHHHHSHDNHGHDSYSGGHDGGWGDSGDAGSCD